MTETTPPKEITWTETATRTCSLMVWTATERVGGEPFGQYRDATTADLSALPDEVLAAANLCRLPIRHDEGEGEGCVWHPEAMRALKENTDLRTQLTAAQTELAGAQRSIAELEHALDHDVKFELETARAELSRVRRFLVEAETQRDELRGELAKRDALIADARQCAIRHRASGLTYWQQCLEMALDGKRMPDAVAELHATPTPPVAAGAAIASAPPATVSKTETVEPAEPGQRQALEHDFPAGDLADAKCTRCGVEPADHMHGRLPPCVNAYAEGPAGSAGAADGDTAGAAPSGAVDADPAPPAEPSGAMPAADPPLVPPSGAVQRLAAKMGQHVVAGSQWVPKVGDRVEWYDEHADRWVGVGTVTGFRETEIVGDYGDGGEFRVPPDWLAKGWLRLALSTVPEQAADKGGTVTALAEALTLMPRCGEDGCSDAARVLASHTWGPSCDAHGRGSHQPVPWLAALCSLERSVADGGGK